MIKLAIENTPEDLKNHINFIQKNMTQYFNTLLNNTLDIAYAVRTFDHADNLNELFSSLRNSLMKNGMFIADITAYENFIIKGGPNKKTRFTDKDGKPIPKGEIYQINNGDKYGIQFINPKYLGLTMEDREKVPDSELWLSPPVEKYCWTHEYIEQVANNNGFQILVSSLRSIIKEVAKFGINIDFDKYKVAENENFVLAIKT